MLGQRLTALVVAILGFAASWTGAAWFLKWPLIGLALVLSIPFVARLFGAVFYRFFVEKPEPEEIQTMEDAELWLMTHGYRIVHTCDAHGGHIVGAKPTRIPLFTAVQQFYIGEVPEDEDQR